MAIEAVCLGWAGRGRQGRASPTVSSWIYGIGAFICLKWPSHLGYFKVLQNSSTYFNHQGISSYICSSSRYFKVFQGISRYFKVCPHDPGGFLLRHFPMPQCGISSPPRDREVQSREITSQTGNDGINLKKRAKKMMVRGTAICNMILDNLWIIYGLYMVSIWIIYG